MNSIYIKNIHIEGLFGKFSFNWTLNYVANILGGKNGSGKSTIFKMCCTLLTKGRFETRSECYLMELADRIIIELSNGWMVDWHKEPHELNEHKRAEELGPGNVFFVDHLDGNPLYTQFTIITDENGMSHNLPDLLDSIHVIILHSFEQKIEEFAKVSRQPQTIRLDDPTALDVMIKEQIQLRNKAFSEVMENLLGDSEEENKARNEFSMKYRQIYSSLTCFLQNYEGSITSSFDFQKDGKKFGYNQLSMGEKQILLLLLMVSNTRQEPCVFFMDEPDLSMHIDWKEQLVTQLNKLNPNMQIILSTHAPSVITGWMECVSEVGQLINK